MYPAVSEFFRLPSKQLIPLNASFKNVYITGFFSTNLYHSTKYQIILFNNVYLKMNHFHNHINSLMYKLLIELGQRDMFLMSNKHFIYFIKINAQLEHRNICFMNCKTKNKQLNISNVFICLSLLIKNFLVILKCLNVENLNVCGNINTMKNVMPYNSKCVYNISAGITNPACFFKRYQKYFSGFEQLMMTNSYPQENICLKSNEYFKKIKTCFNKWFRYKIAILLLLISRKLIKTKTLNINKKSSMILQDNYLHVLSNGTARPESKIYNHPTNSFENINFSMIDEFKNFDNKCFHKPLDHDIGNIGNILQSKPKNIICSFEGNSNITSGTNHDDWFNFKKTVLNQRKELCSNNFIAVERNIYVPKGFSPIMNASIKPDILSNAPEIQQTNQFKTYITAKDKLNNFMIKLSQDYPKNLPKFYSRETFTSLDKSIFKAINVLGQVDNKYIVCDCCIEDQPNKFVKYLVLLDQHAADERVQLEKLFSRFMDSVSEGFFRTHFTEDVLILDEMKDEEIATVLQFSKYFFKYGIHFKETSCHRLAITAVPEFLHWLAMRRMNGVTNYYNFIKMAINNIVAEQLAFLGECGNVTNVMPSVIHQYFCREACLAAVNFGKKLSITYCEKIIRNLADCIFPFMCAHGRPVLCILGELPLKPKCVLPPTLTSLRRNIH